MYVKGITSESEPKTFAQGYPVVRSFTVLWYKKVLLYWNVCMFQSYKATKGFDVSDWCKNFEIVFLGEEGKSFILSFNRDIYLSS